MALDGKTYSHDLFTQEALPFVRQQIAKAAHTSNPMFPSTYEEGQKAAPRGATPGAKGNAGQ